MIWLRLLLLLVITCMTACEPTAAAIKQTPSPSASAQLLSPSPMESVSAAPTPSAAPTGAQLSLATIQRLNLNVGYLAAWTGGGPTLARTDDNGATWHAIKIPAARVTSLRFIDKSVGWIGADIPRPMAGVDCQQAPPKPMDPCYGAVLRTVDGGTTWRKSLLIVDDGVNGDPIVQIQAIDGYVAWALTLACNAGSSPSVSLSCPRRLYRTTDGGITWSSVATGYVEAIRFATSSRGWLAAANPDGSFDIRVTSDGGRSWANKLRTTSGSVVGLDAANALTAWVITQAGGYCTATTCGQYELFRTTDGGQSWSSLGNPKTSAAGNCWGGHLVGPLFASPDLGWLAENIGAGGAAATTGLLQTRDGGKTWHCANQPVNSYIVSAADPLHVWVMSNPTTQASSAIFTSEDGGASWRQLKLGALAT
jgi:photosystem II stability/assembly factor-like uncharacterized protein